MGLFDRLFGRKEKEETPVLEKVQAGQGADTEEQIASDTERVHDVSEEDRDMREPVEAMPTELLEEVGTIEQATSEVAEERSDVQQYLQDFMVEHDGAKEVATVSAKGKEQEASQTKDVQLEEVVASQSVSESEEEKYQRTLKKTRTGFSAKLNAFFANFRSVDEDFFEELEELLIMSDVGVQVASSLTEALRYEARLENAKKPEILRRLMIEKLVEIYEKDGQFSEQIAFQKGLTVMLFVGVNGVGKTTSIGKLAYRYKQAGKKVMLVAADTFRAGAVAQLVEWGHRVDVPVVTGPEKSDPASVVFDGMEKALAEQVDILMIDTAGRLQNKENLMAELEKIGRIIKRSLPDAPHETLLALDASTGQNALVQAKEFSKITPLTGLVLTKLDGTARGGIVLAIRQELDIPVKLIGFGEKIDDIGEFHSEAFMRGLLEGLV
ncbi:MULTISPECIES: signal recognition particle-docking protein FtsY [unclassified Streptococcus]|uniref:signal recognition particle-docking protein FtsY n=1 Tax=unclassified Streptococcus TaxID=2608887 RepID=UPI001071ADC0|nr:MULTISPECIES: signal recognition particle-docking protein FtsY [unclassified Streptococcus]MBF0787974.1 signal recognition particle-docking protein FtsY [Streptococcus sp. 19428wC2_LYSM12]MCQ9210965.1 signal recognition particle-docking protein FtsY [Streptococcus sp. B01]MCQ9214235.1 signal recognition particle-docking protein FtsY [Streptococcus sp. O1]TFV05023.1 signal recognition particle-docking protein FtsY [Streptococcus sp. LYSM12]